MEKRIEKSAQVHDMGGIPIHRMVVKLPIGCLIATALFDVIGLLTANALFYQLSFYLIATALVSSLVAVGFGIADWRRLPDPSPERSTAFGHGWIMACAITCYTYSFILRFNVPTDPRTGSLSIAFLGLAFLVLGAHRGATLTSRYGVGTRFSHSQSTDPNTIEQDELAIRRKGVKHYANDDHPRAHGS